MKSSIGAALVAAGVLTFSHVSATTYAEKKLQGSGSPYMFGTSMAVTSGQLLIGSPGEDVNQGAVYAFTPVNGAWTGTQEIQPADAAPSDYFGFSVAISGTTAVIGAYAYGGQAHPAMGKAYIYEYANGTWYQAAILNADDAHSYNFFGFAVAISGSTVLIGAPQIAGPTPGAGAVYVFTRNPAAGWLQSQKLTTSDAATLDAFGSAISMSATTALIGAPRQNTLNPRPGAAYVFTSSGGTWSQQQELGASTYQILDGFGSSVALWNSTAVVGAPKYTVNGNSIQGEAFAFRLVNGTWGQNQIISIAQGMAGDLFGDSVALFNGSLLVGASRATINGQAGQGAAYLLLDTNNQFVLSRRFTATDAAAGDFFGSSVAIPTLISGLTPPPPLFVGAPNVHFSGASHGQAYVYMPQ